MKIRVLLVVFSFMLGISFVFSQGKSAAISADGVRFVNTGGMNVSGVMYVQGDMQMVNDPADLGRLVEVIMPLEGTVHLEGSFFHDAAGNVFDITNRDWADYPSQPRDITGSSGIVRFVTGNSGSRRYIASTVPLNFDREANYIAFPRLEIHTNDVIYVPPTMGLDARTIIRHTDSIGVLYLASDPVTRDGDFIYTASLRVTGHNGIFTVSDSSVFVEQRVQEFRETGGGGEATMLLPFASPFTNMRAGVFAGNWVRCPRFDDAANSFRFPYGNEGPAGGKINSNQYIRDAVDPLIPAEAHLIRLRHIGGHYDDLALTYGYHHPDGMPTFVFGTGNPWPGSGMEPQCDGTLVTGINLLANRSTKATTPNNFTQNWIVGNSFTSGLDGQAIAEYLMDASAVHSGPGAYFIPSLFIFPHGATSYETYNIMPNSQNVIETAVSDIHAMGVFMIAAWSGDGTTNQIPNVIPVIDHRFQIHTGGIPSQANDVGRPLLDDGTIGPRSSRAQSNNVLNFVLTPEENPFVFSRTSIRLNENADLNSDNHNVHALRNASNRLFHLYGTNRSREILQQNVLPYTAPLAMLSVNPASESLAMVLRVEGADNFATDVVELYDRQTGYRQDLRANNSYWFVMNPGDDADRFEVHFARRITTDDPDDTVLPWQAYSFGGELIITDLSPSHQGAQARIHNASGVLHIQQPIVSVPEQRISIASLPAGVYLLSIEGRTVKFIK